MRLPTRQDGVENRDKVCSVFTIFVSNSIRQEPTSKASI